MQPGPTLPLRPARPPARRRWLRPAAWVLAAVVLGATFTAYLDPHLTRDLADRAWACFG